MELRNTGERRGREKNEPYILANSGCQVTNSLFKLVWDLKTLKFRNIFRIKTSDCTNVNPTWTSAHPLYIVAELGYKPFNQNHHILDLPRELEWNLLRNVCGQKRESQWTNFCDSFAAKTCPGWKPDDVDVEPCVTSLKSYSGRLVEWKTRGWNEPNRTELNCRSQGPSVEDWIRRIHSHYRALCMWTGWGIWETGVEWTEWV